jgi:hypothetical protein
VIWFRLVVQRYGETRVRLSLNYEIRRISYELYYILYIIAEDIIIILTIYKLLVLMHTTFARVLFIIIALQYTVKEEQTKYLAYFQKLSKFGTILLLSCDCLFYLSYCLW